MGAGKTDFVPTGELEHLRGKPVFITGITSPLGVEVAGLLSGAGAYISGLARNRIRAEDLLDNAEIIEGCCEDPGSYREQLRASTYVIHIAGMHLSYWIIRACAGHDRLERILFISSARALYPDRLLSKKEIAGKKLLLENEMEVSTSLLPWTILRPTLIFSPRDRSLSKVKKYMEANSYFPLPGSGEAVKQPISARDLAVSTVRALVSPAANQKVYNVPGEEITVREILEMIAGEIGKKVKLVRIPKLPAAVLMRGFDTVGLERWAGSLNMFLRWYQDVRFSGEAANEDFGHNPRSFGENLHEQLVGRAVE